MQQTFLCCLIPGRSVLSCWGWRTVTPFGRFLIVMSCPMLIGLYYISIDFLPCTLAIDTWIYHVNCRSTPGQEFMRRSMRHQGDDKEAAWSPFWLEEDECLARRLFWKAVIFKLCSLSSVSKPINLARLWKLFLSPCCSDAFCLRKMFPDSWNSRQEWHRYLNHAGLVPARFQKKSIQGFFKKKIKKSDFMVKFSETGE